MISWFTKNWFLLCLLASAALGFIFPGAGATGGWMRTEVTTQIGVAVLFFIRGTLLPLAELKRGVLSWRIHLLVHGFIFVVLPILTIAILWVLSAGWAIHPDLRLGFIFVAALPTTVSTAAVFTSMTRGNTAAAVFNSTVSNCLAVVVVPLLVAALLQRDAAPIPLGPVIFQIFLLVLAPLLVGQAVKPFLWNFSVTQKKALEIISSLIVLFVIFAAFANSVEARIWQEQAWQMIVGGLGIAVLIFVAATGLAIGTGKVLRLARGDYLCLVFTGPQKTLAGGVTIANIMFAGEPGLTLILLPVLFYHFIQLFAGGFMVERYRREEL